MISAFFYGVLLAFGLIIPLGIQNIFVFNQGATQPILVRALPSVITAFFCDLVLILSAISGVSLIVLALPWLKNTIFGIGILFLFVMGYSTWRTQLKNDQSTGSLTSKEQIIFAASVSLLNPHALLDTIGVIGTNSLYFSGTDKLAYTFACILVSFFWFMSLSIAGYCFSKFDKTGYGVAFVNKISAVIMWLVAVYLIWQII